MRRDPATAMDNDYPASDAPPVIALTLCGLLLLAMAILHVIRVYFGWALMIGAWAVPLWTSSLAAALLAALAFWILLTAYHLR
jgi:hypothetical protein